MSIQDRLIPIDVFRANIEQRKKYIRVKDQKASTIDTPTQCSLQSSCGAIYDQGQMGSCTANAICGVLRMLYKDVEYSRLFVYIQELMKEHPHQVLKDVGADSLDGLVAMSIIGICEESFCPYSDHAQALKKKPSAKAYKNALTHRFSVFADVTNQNPQLIDTIRQCISNNKPVLLAFLVFDQMETMTDGYLQLPNKSSKLLGGHQVVVVGYDEQYLTIMNSWGADWCLNGFFKMPVAYLQASFESEPLVPQLLTMGSLAPSVKQPTCFDDAQVELAHIAERLDQIAHWMESSPKNK